jgi:DNA-binding NarL/FixJ family response regulator
MPRLLLADDHELFRAALREVLDAEPDLEVVGETALQPDLLAQVRRVQPDVLVLDLQTPYSDGAETIEHLRRRHPKLRILVLTGHPEDHIAVLCLRAGADGFISKDQAAHDLLTAVRHVARGRKYVSPPLAERLATSLAGGAPGRAPHEKLSHRERQVLQRLGEARSVSEIARELGLSVKTVSTYRSRAIEKLGLQTSAQAILYAIQHGLVDPFTARRRDPSPARDPGSRST